MELHRVIAGNIVRLFVIAVCAGFSCSSGSDNNEDAEEQEDLTAADGSLEIGEAPDQTDDDSWKDTGRSEDLQVDTAPDVVEPAPETVDQAGPEVMEEIVELDPEDLAAIKGLVVDGDGAPIADLFVQPCTYTESGEKCHKATSDETGFFEKVFDPALTGITAIHVRFVTDVYTATACYYTAEEMPFADNVVDFAEPLVIFEMGSPVATVEPGVTGDTEVDIGGAQVTVPAEAWFPGIFEAVEIRGRKYPLQERTPCFVSEETMPDQLYVFSPDWIGFSTPGGLEITFDNTAALTPGETVSLWVLGQLDTQIRPAEGDPVHVHTGEWVEFGTATVADDGGTIVSDSGTGMPGLGWIGWKKMSQ